MRDVLSLLVRELRPYKWLIAVSSLGAGLAAGFDTLAPVLLGRAFDAAVAKSPLMTAGMLLAGWFVARALGDAVRSYLAYRGSLLANDVADSYVRRAGFALLRKPLSFHYGKKSQESSDALSEMRWSLEQMINGIVFDLWPAVLALAVTLGYVAWLDWRIAASLGLSSACFVWFSYATTPQVLKNQKAWTGARRKASSAAWDAIRNILVVKSATNEEFVAARVDRYADETTPLIRADFSFDRTVRDGQNFIIALGSFAAVAFAVIRVRAGDLTFGQLTSVVAYTFAVFGYVRYAQWQARTFIRLTTNANAVREMLDQPDEDYSSGDERQLTGAVEYRNVRFRYREDKAALEDVAFTVKAGSRVAIVGESGEGKTTLVDLLGRYYLPQSGAVLFDGVDGSGINLRSLRSQMAYVPQDLTLFHESIGFNIRYGRPDATDEQVREAARLAHLDEFIDALPEKYDTLVGERGMKLSGGERQRVALARAFLRDPRILVLDEPTAHLDSKTEEFVRQSLDVLMRGRTTFIIAHRLRTVMDADLILVLKDGRIAESGRHDELARKKGGAYAALLAAQGGFLSPDEPHVGDVSAA